MVRSGGQVPIRPVANAPSSLRAGRVWQDSWSDDQKRRFCRQFGDWAVACFCYAEPRQYDSGPVFGHMALESPNDRCRYIVKVRSKKGETRLRATIGDDRRPGLLLSGYRMAKALRWACLAHWLSCPRRVGGVHGQQLEAIRRADRQDLWHPLGGEEEHGV